MIEDYYSGKTIDINHVDGWSFFVSYLNDEEGISVHYRDQPGENRKEEMRGLSAETARRIGMAMIELANEIDPQAPVVIKESTAEFQKGFYAGIAYLEHGDDAIGGAHRAAAKLRQ